MDKTLITAAIEAGRRYLGIELGSTRVKGVLILADGSPAATEGFTWEQL